MTVVYANGEVNLAAATPALGFSMEIDDAGPQRVRVEFESDEVKFSIRAEWKDGRLEVEIQD